MRKACNAIFEANDTVESSLRQAQRRVTQVPYVVKNEFTTLKKFD